MGKSEDSQAPGAWPLCIFFCVVVLTVGGCQLLVSTTSQEATERTKQEAIKAGLVQDLWGRWVKPQ